MTTREGGHAIVIGGTQGSGRAVVARLASERFRVTAVGRGASDPQAGVVFRSADAGHIDDLAAALRAAVAEEGAVDVLVCMQRFRGDGDSWEGELRISLTATKTAIDVLHDSFADGACIVLGSSHAARLVATEQPVGYHVAKAGMCQLARYYAVALGPKGIRVNCVTPGIIVKPGREPGRDVEALASRITPLGRPGTPDDVAAAVSLLCDDRARFVTGQELIVDGGVSLIWQETLASDVAGFSVT
jgi:NAD(P)-dependent dehydrogenase (short-subunit alcohol dehydrogenase family)